MSKSLGNSLTIRDALKMYNYEVIKYLMFSKHYASDIDILDSDFQLSERHMYYFYSTIKSMENFITSNNGNVKAEVLEDEIPNTIISKFEEVMDDDFNTANGVTVLFDMAKWINSGNYDQTVKDAFEKMLQVFGIVFEEEVLDEDIEKLIEERQAARANKDFATADRIRDELAAQGIKLLDTKEGVRWTRD